MFLNNSPLLSKEWLAVGVIGNRWYLNISSVLSCLSAYSASFYFHLHCSIHHSTPCFGHTVLSPCSKSFRPTELQRVWPAGATVALSAHRGTLLEDLAKQLEASLKSGPDHRKQHISPLLSPSLQTWNMHNVKDSNNQYPRRIIISLANQTRSNVKLIPFHVNLTLRLKQNIKNWIEWWFQLIDNYVFFYIPLAFITLGITDRKMLLIFCCFVFVQYICVTILSGRFLQKPENLLNEQD